MQMASQLGKPARTAFVRKNGGWFGPGLPAPDMPAAATSLAVPKPGFATVQVDLPRSTFREAGSHVLHMTITPPRRHKARLPDQ